MKANYTLWQGHLSMFSANAMWGLMSPMAKLVIIGGAVSPLVLTNMRIFGAMVLFWIGSFFQKPEHIPPKDMLRLFGAALLGIVFNQGCFIFGVGLTSPSDASIITTSMPLWAMILAAFILKEPVTAKKVAGIAFGAMGALLLIFGGMVPRRQVVEAHRQYSEIFSYYALSSVMPYILWFIRIL